LSIGAEGLKAIPLAQRFRMSGRREFDQWEERRIPLCSTGLASSVPVARPDIRSKAVAAFDQAIGRKDE
jgi:hypothetical protein